MIKYYFNKEKRTTTAVMCGIEDDARDKITELLKSGNRSSSFWFDVLIETDRKKSYLMPNKMVGIARCHKDDEWNEEEGMKAAKENLMKTYNAVLANKVAIILDDLLYCVDPVAAYIYNAGVELPSEKKN